MLSAVIRFISSKLGDSIFEGVLDFRVRHRRPREKAPVSVVCAPCGDQESVWTAAIPGQVSWLLFYCCDKTA